MSVHYYDREVWGGLWVPSWTLASRQDLAPREGGYYGDDSTLQPGQLE